MLKQNENNLFRDRQETVRCLWFLWCDDLVCDWLHHNKHSRHILGVHANMITAVSRSVKRNAKNATAPFPKSRASYFRFPRFNTSALYYLRAWLRLKDNQLVETREYDSRDGSLSLSLLSCGNSCFVLLKVTFFGCAVSWVGVSCKNR